MTAYVVTSLSGTHEILAESQAAALRTFSQQHPGQPVLSVAPAALQRAVEQQN